MTAYIEHEPFHMLVNTEKNIIKDIRPKGHLYIKMSQILALRETLPKTEMPELKTNVIYLHLISVKEELSTKRSHVQ